MPEPTQPPQPDPGALPALQGTRKQTQWAEDIRSGWAARHTSHAEAEEILRTLKTARWWIDNRDDVLGGWGRQKAIRTLPVHHRLLPGGRGEPYARESAHTDLGGPAVTEPGHWETSAYVWDYAQAEERTAEIDREALQMLVDGKGATATAWKKEQIKHAGVSPMTTRSTYPGGPLEHVWLMAPGHAYSVTRSRVTTYAGVTPDGRIEVLASKDAARQWAEKHQPKPSPDDILASAVSDIDFAALLELDLETEEAPEAPGAPGVPGAPEAVVPEEVPEPTAAQRATRAIDSLGWTRAEAARRLGVHAVHVTRWYSQARADGGDTGAGPGRSPSGPALAYLDLAEWLAEQHAKTWAEHLTKG